MDSESLTNDGEQLIACGSCLAKTARFEAFCRKCGAPVGNTATIAPVQTIRTEAYLLHRALEGRPRLIVVVGVWIVHLPVLILSVGALIYVLPNQRGTIGFLLFWGMLGFSVFALIVQYRVTRNYLSIPKS